MCKIQDVHGVELKDKQRVSVKTPLIDFENATLHKVDFGFLVKYDSGRKDGKITVDKNRPNHKNKHVKVLINEKTNRH